MFRKQQRTEMNHLPESYDGKTQIMSHAAGWPLKMLALALNVLGCYGTVLNRITSMFRLLH